MGRTVMPFSYLLEKEHGKWKEFRKVLTKENQAAFDRLFDRGVPGTPYLFLIYRDMVDANGALDLGDVPEIMKSSGAA